MAGHLCGPDDGQLQRGNYVGVWRPAGCEFEKSLHHGSLAARVEILPATESVTPEDRRLLAFRDCSELPPRARMLGLGRSQPSRQVQDIGIGQVVGEQHGHTLARRRLPSWPPAPKMAP